MKHHAFRLALLLVPLAACGTDEPAAVVTSAPRCVDLAAPDAKGLLAHAVVPTAAVRESLIFGGMDPGTLEPINFELGFLLEGTNVPVTAPADLYVHTIEFSRYLVGSRAGETDYALGFDVCSEEGSGQVQVAVEGQLAHVTALEPSLLAQLDGALECQTKTGPEETVENCSAFMEGPAAVVITAGERIGSAGGTGLSAYRPGLDLNLLDTRFPTPYVNRDRIGADEGPGRWFRYGACVYEYFTGATRAAYLAKVGQAGDLRVDAAAPCGTMAIDQAGTAAGIWMRADMAALDFASDWMGVLGHLLVLAPHPVTPVTRGVVSSELTSISNVDGHARLVEFDRNAQGDVNRAFAQMTPGTIHCIDGAGIGQVPTPHAYYLEVGAAGDTLTIERLGASCAQTAQAARAFTAAAIAFVR